MKIQDININKLSSISLSRDRQTTLTKGHLRLHLIIDQSEIKAKLINQQRPDLAGGQNVTLLKQNLLNEFVEQRRSVLKELEKFIAGNGFASAVDVKRGKNDVGTKNYIEIDCQPVVLEALERAKAENYLSDKIKEIRDVTPVESMGNFSLRELSFDPSYRKSLLDSGPYS